MPISTTALATTLLSSSPSWFAKGVGDATVQAGNAPITPRDPTTLTLAIIGVGTLALYFVARRQLRTRRDSMVTVNPLRDFAAKSRLVDAIEQQPPREAA